MPYVPRKSDIVIVSLEPQIGHEQQGRRTALVVSNDLFNERTGLCIVCPITTTTRSYPFHVVVPEGAGVSGVVMVDQVESIDFRARAAKPVGPAPAAVLDEVLAVLDACLY